MKKFLIFTFILSLFSTTSFANQLKWTDWRDIGVIYTYGYKDTLYVYLNDERCNNQKAYLALQAAKWIMLVKSSQ
ncbi:hypothetical protein SOPP22_01365 [Shewanella sp. OPT22]|nr:hypothetical protein SOPP22_01365 [Shewanella sp. OPT22]